MQPQKYYSSAPSSDLQLGLETLTICPKKNQTEKHCNSCMIASSVVSSTASSLIGDYIGMESCFDVDRTEAVVDASGDVDFSGVCSKICRRKREQRCRRVNNTREFPPPIPSLARTENLFSHMPWVLKRFYTSDGRLIIKEEKVKHHEYFRAHRSNGRLILHLVPLDGDYADDGNSDLGPHRHHPIEDVEDHHNIELEEEEEEETKEEEAQVNDFDGDIDNADDDDDDKSNIVAEILDNNSGVIEDSMLKCSSVAENPSMENGLSAANAGTFLNYSSVRASPTCFLGMPVPAIRPVHS